MRPKARTVQPAANEPLVNGLQNAHVDCLAVVHVACRKHRHTRIFKKKILNLLCTANTRMSTQTGQHTLTLCDGKDQIPFLQELPVQSWGPKEEVRDRSETCPANSWLDVLLQVGLQTKTEYSA